VKSRSAIWARKKGDNYRRETYKRGLRIERFGDKTRDYSLRGGEAKMFRPEKLG